MFSLLFNADEWLSSRLHVLTCLRADVELGLASRSDLLQILNHTVHGGKSVLGGPDASDGESRRLDRSLFPGSQDQLQTSNSNSNLSLNSNSPATPTASPGGVFQMDSPAASGLESAPSALFPATLDSAQSSTSTEAYLSDQDQEQQQQDASTSSGNIFSMTDTAHNSDPSVHGARQAGPPPPSPAQLRQQQQQPQLQPQPQLQQQPPQQQQQQPENDYQAQLPATERAGPRRKLYAYGIADPEYMSLPCKMSMKHARVTVNHETNHRLYGKKLPGQVGFGSSSTSTLLPACHSLDRCQKGVLASM